MVVTAFILVMQLLKGNILVPRVMKGSVGLSPLLAVLAVLVGATPLGPVGGIIAITRAARSDPVPGSTPPCTYLLTIGEPILML